jgi:hypothetical protein
MRGGSFASVGLFVAILTATLLAPSRARGADAEPSAERIKSASEEFDKGRRAYLANDFAEAAVHFENAYHDAPRPEPLRSAIRARLAAHDDARAATLASLAAVRYATDPATMSLANATLSDLSSRLLGVSVACDPECGVAADGRVVSVIDATQFVFYLAPGKHDLLVSWSGDRAAHLRVEGDPGSVREVKLVAPPLPPKPAVLAVPDARTARVDALPPKRKPLGPAVFFVGAGLTVAGVAATIVSGIAAQNDPGVDAVRRDCVGLGSSCPEYQRGKDAELRTNVLLAGTAGVGAVTTVIGVFLTQWTRPPTSSTTASSQTTVVFPYASAAPGAVGLGLRGAF